MNLVFDIETASYNFEDLSESQQEFLLRYAEKEKDEVTREEKKADAIRFMSRYALTARVIVIGMLNTATGNSLILFESENAEEWQNEENKITYRGISEVDMLNLFWEYTLKATKVISFDGWHFDIPFLKLRSAIHRIKPSRAFGKSRFDKSQHLDLLELLTDYNLTKKFNLDFYCHSFDIESPKGKGITGMEVKELYNAGRIKELAVYCAEDVRATYELYKIWDEYLNI